MSLDDSRADMPFGSQSELLDCFGSVLDLHIYYIYKYHPWIGPDSKLQNMMGVVVTREEFENNLLRAADSTAYAALTPDEQAELSGMREYFLRRVESSIENDSQIPLIRLADIFSLDTFRFLVIAALLCAELDRKYEKLFAYLQDDITKKSPTPELLIRLFAEPGTQVSALYSNFTRDGVLTRCLTNRQPNGTLTLADAVTDFLLETGGADADRYTPDAAPHPLYVNEDLYRCVENAARAADSGKCTLIYLEGQKGSGRKFFVRHCAYALGRSVLFLKAAGLAAAESMEQMLTDAITACVLRGDFLCITGFEEMLTEENRPKLPAFTRTLALCGEYLQGAFFLTAAERWQDAGLPESIVRMDFRLPDPDEAMRLVLWERYLQGMSLAEVIDPEEMAAKFRFTAGQIEAAITRSADLTRLSGGDAITTAILHQSCYDQVVVGLNSLASPIKPAYDWDDLVLPASEIRMLKEACSHVKFRHTVYNRWGMGKRAAYGRGLSMLFSGPPGTGKTMAAQVVTNQLHMQMYKIQLSQIVSKYIGETEKNLRQVFTEAKNANCILFFDEMDALFGKRSEVKDSHDRHANIETTYLLQQMEEYDGVVLMATNLLQNIDEAFMRRINFVIAFPFPDTATRRLLWMKMLDTGAPVSDDVDFDFLAENFKIAGGNIKNCVVHAAFLAAAENTEISMRHLVSSVVSEQRKNNVVVLREDLREYADLVFGEKS